MGKRMRRKKDGRKTCEKIGKWGKFWKIGGNLEN